ncbi:MAG TPA: tetratricopeptide repeat protein [Verrucomicrobiae bacterium]|nr:tetratricopeptide repeat protein [Verrucomicrobiae bacterium]
MIRPVRPKFALALAFSILLGAFSQLQTSAQTPSASDSITFNKDIAPILFKNCAPCHRPGQSAPFNLLTYSEAKKHAGGIAKATRTHYMPPWLPEAGCGEFMDERRLTAEQIELIQDWVAAGAPEGRARDMPPPPNFAEGWLLGKPDLIVQTPQAYVLAPEGADLYRNFVIPAPLLETRFVRAIEFHPRSRGVHHVRIKLDPTRQSRRLDEQDPEPGFPGMRTPGKFPPGHLLTWIPGKLPSIEPDGMQWVLEKDTDLVLQIHLQRSGKAEQIQPEIGFYFTNQPPNANPYLIGLLAESIDIPAGEKDHLIERTFELPVGVDLLNVLPHLHYLGKQVQSFATLPDGTQQCLLSIPNWDFNWQGEYRYRPPIFLPAHSKITMRLTYDNSAENVRNPNHPIRRVTFGPQSTDEMGELWLQVLPRDPADLPALEKAHNQFRNLETIAYYENQLRLNAGDSEVHTALGKLLGPMGKLEPAIQHFQAAIQLDPAQVEAHYYLGLSLYTIREWNDAQEEFETALRLDPKHVKAHDALGLLLLKLNKPAEAEAHFKRAIELNPEDAAARNYLRGLDGKR